MTTTGDAIPFIKMHGCENDYVFVDGFVTSLPDDPSELARTVSRRRSAVGADGLVFLVPPTDGQCDVEMRVWNADGSSARMCGTAARCIAVLMQREQRVQDLCRIRIANRIITATDIRSESDSATGAATVDMGRADMLSPAQGDRLSFGGATDFVTIFRVDVGNPHAVVFTPDAGDDLVRSLGPAIEGHEEFPDRTNVEFVMIDGDANISVRVWERGSGETRSCGSGACAAAVAAWSTGRVPRDHPCVIRQPGGELTVTRHPDGNVSLSGPVCISYTGVLSRA